jgi:hypothetical protein
MKKGIILASQITCLAVILTGTGLIFYEILFREITRSSVLMTGLGLICIGLPFLLWLSKSTDKLNERKKY